MRGSEVSSRSGCISAGLGMTVLGVAENATGVSRHLQSVLNFSQTSASESKLAPEPPNPNPEKPQPLQLETSNSSTEGYTPDTEI